MDKKELAALLDGRQYLEEINPLEAEAAKENGLVVVFGYSDDNIEFRGAIDDEWGAWEGGTIWAYKSGHAERSGNLFGICKKIEAVWADDAAPAWTYKTEIPHETFRIYEDDDLFCIGIIFSLQDI